MEAGNAVAPWLDRYRTPIIVGLAALLAAAAVYIAIDQSREPDALVIRPGALTPAPGGPIEVYITGAIAQPGVYEMTDGERVVDLLYKAGGPAPNANLEAINLAKRLYDEDQVVVPRIGETVSGVAGVASVIVNINTATAEELDTVLPGIGEVYSQRIVESRTTIGLFTSTKELLERELIPQATYDGIRDMITVGP